MLLSYVLVETLFDAPRFLKENRIYEGEHIDYASLFCNYLEYSNKWVGYIMSLMGGKMFSILLFPRFHCSNYKQ